MYFLMTNDVEAHSLSLNREDPGTVDLVHKVGLPRLLDLLAKHDVSSTFYFTGMFAEASPESVELVRDHWHEIGCHGYDHSPQRAFDLLGYEEQVDELKKAKDAIEPVAGRVTSFRAPALRINEDTVRALEETGFSSDSSIASQRFDGPFTFGAAGKLKWLRAPRKPYMLSYESVVREGDSGVLEVPISALVFPFIGTVMRVSPLILKMLRKYLYYESKNTGKPIVFLYHPNECLDALRVKAARRADSFMGYLFADVIRHRLKLRNLGAASLRLLDEVLASARVYGFEFVSVNEYRKMYKINRH